MNIALDTKLCDAHHNACIEGVIKHIKLVMQHYACIMAQQYTCPICLYSTTTLGNFNKHKYVKCKPKQLEQCTLCFKRYKKGGSGLRKHECLAINSLECFDEHCMPVDFALKHLTSLSNREIKQQGFLSLNPIDVALITFNLP